jgi:hypothetical protein
LKLRGAAAILVGESPTQTAQALVRQQQQLLLHHC